MKSRGLLIALIVLAALVGLLYWSNRAPSPKTSEAASSAPAIPKILTLNQADIVKVEVKRKGADDVVLAKNSSGAWQITSPKGLRADADAVSGMLSTLSSLNAERVVDEKAGDLQSYGLAPPSAELVITENGNKSRQLLIGDDTPTHSGAYAALAGDPRVFTIAGYTKTSLDKGLDDFRNKKLFDFGYTEPAKIEFKDGAKSYVLTKNSADWSDADGKKLDPAGADAFVDKLRELKTDKFTESGFGNPAIVITVTPGNGSQAEKVLVSKNGASYTARRENDPSLYQLDAKTIADLQKAVTELKPAGK